MTTATRRLAVTVVAVLLATGLVRHPVVWANMVWMTEAAPLRGPGLAPWIGGWLVVALLSWGLGRRAEPGKPAVVVDQSWVGLVAVALGAWGLWLLSPALVSESVDIRISLWNSSIELSPGVAKLTLLLEVAGLVGLTEWVQRRGVGHGVVLLWLVPGTAVYALMPGWSGIQQVTEPVLYWGLLGASLTVGFAAVRFMPRPSRTVLAGPASGLGHLLLVSWVFAVLPDTRVLPLPVLQWLQEPSQWAFWGPMLLAVPVLAWWTHPPVAQAPWLAAHPEVAPEARSVFTTQAVGLAKRRLWTAARPTGMLLAAIVTIDHFDELVLQGAVEVLSGFFIGGAVADAVADWEASQKGLTETVYTETRVHVLGPIEEALATEDIAVHYRHRGLRTLFGIFGPYVEVEVQVSEAHRADAVRILRQLEDEASAAAERLSSAS